MRTILFVLSGVVLTVGLNLPAWATVQSMTVKVDGLACPFCAYGLEKQLNKVEGIENLDIDVAAGEVVLSIMSDTRLTAGSVPGMEKSAGLILQVQQAVEKAGFTPRALKATVEGHVVVQTEEVQLSLTNTEESLVLEQNISSDELRKIGRAQPVQVVGVLHPDTSPLRFTVERIVSSEAVADVCRLEIAGMMCSGCVEAIRADLDKREGIQNVQIDLESGIAEIVVEDGRISAQTLVEWVNSLAMEGMPAGTFKATAIDQNSR